MARRPLLASRHGASREILGDDYPWLVTPGDPAALASTIEAILAEAPARRAQLVARQFERAMALFSLPATMRRIEAAVEFAV
jgi:glycosyltransferase involved in cell wall biosynthesis